MTKRRLLVTGSRGFVGGALLRQVQAHHGAFEPVGFVDPLGAGPADLADPAAVERAVRAAAPDAVIHLAAVAAPREARRDPARAWAVNLMGTVSLAGAVLRHAPAADFIWAGSSEAYGMSFNATPQPLNETAALEPASAYGATKAAGDMMLRQMAREGLRVTVFRPFNHTGPGQSANYVVAAFAEQVARIEAGLQAPVIKVGNLEARRDFLDVRDVAAAYLIAAEKSGENFGEAYNLSTASPVRIGAILEMLTGLARVPVTVETDPARYVENDVPVASGNAGKAWRDFGWRPSIPLEQSVKDVLDDWRGRVLG